LHLKFAIFFPNLLETLPLIHFGQIEGAMMEQSDEPFYPLEISALPFCCAWDSCHHILVTAVRVIICLIVIMLWITSDDDVLIGPRYGQRLVKKNQWHPENDLRSCQAFDTGSPLLVPNRSLRIKCYSLTILEQVLVIW